MTERMTEEQARVWLLQEIRQGVVVANNSGEDVLTLETEDLERLGDEMGGWTVAEVSGLYKRLVRGGFLRQVRGETDFLELNGVLQHAWVEDLTDDGYRAIGVLSGDPTRQLVESMDALVHAIVQAEGVAEDEKDRAKAAAEELKTFSRNLAPGAAMSVLKAVAASLGIPLP